MNSTSEARLEKPPSSALPSFEVLVEQTSDDLYRLAARLTGDAAEADDVLQVAYLKVFEALRAGTFRHECRLETWLYRIVTHTAFDARRAGKRRERLAVDGERPDIAPARLDAAVALGELRAALETLPEDQRAALVLKELQGLSTRETADVLQRTEGAVEQLLVRARATLRKRFEP